MNFDYLINKEQIDLSFNGLHDDNIEILIDVLEKSTVLTQLNLYENLIALSNDKFTNALAANETLKVLSLGSNQIEAEGGKRLAAALKINKSLRELHIGANRMGDATAEALADALTTNESLQMISMYGNLIGDQGAFALAESFEINQTLRVLWMHENKIGDAAARQMAQSLKRNCSIEKIFLLGNKKISKNVEKEVQSVIDDLKSRKSQIGDQIAAKKAREMASRQLEESVKKVEELAGKDAEIATLKEEVKCKHEEVSKKDEELKAKDEEIAALMAALEALKNSTPVAPPVTEHDLKTKLSGVSFEIAEYKSPFDDARDDCANEDPLDLNAVASTE